MAKSTAVKKPAKKAPAKKTSKIIKKPAKAVEKKAAPEFKVGDLVAWTSQAAGSTKSKKGVVVAIIPPGTAGYLKLQDELRKRSTTHRMSHGWGHLGRKVTSYLVEVTGASGRSKPAIYWPLTSKLAAVKQQPAVVRSEKKPRALPPFNPFI